MVVYRKHDTKLFIYVLFITLSIFNYTNQVLRPTELFIPFLILVFISKIKTVKTILIYGLLLLLYLIIIDVVNNGFSPETLSGSRVWIYAILFFALAKIFVSINYIQYKTTIYKAMILSILLIFFIYFLLYFDNAFTIKYFSPSGIMSEGSFSVFKATNRILGVSTVIFLFFIVFTYVMNAEKNKLAYTLFLINIFMFYFLQSRTFLVTFLITFLILYGTKRIWSTLLFSLLFFSVSIKPLIYLLNNSEKFHIYARKLSEIVYFASSPSLFVRFNDTLYFINDWLSNWNTFFFGRGFNFLLSYPRFGFDFNPLTGELEIYDTYIVWQLRHNADNLLSIIIVEGGFFLLLFCFVLFLIMVKKIYKNDKRLATAFTFIFLIYVLSSVHLLTNYVLVFTMAYIYYAKRKKMKINIKKSTKGIQ